MLTVSVVEVSVEVVRYEFATERPPRTGRFTRRPPATHQIRRGGDDGEVVLSLPHLVLSERKGEHALSGPLGEGSVLVRRGYGKFELRDASGTVCAAFKQKVPRPGRRFRPSWEVTGHSGHTSVLVEEAPFGALKVGRKQKAGEPIAHWRSEGFETAMYGSARATLDLEPGRWPQDELTAIVAAIVAWRTHRPADWG